jgi:hypothetical protein
MHGAYDVHDVIVITSRGFCASGLERMQVLVIVCMSMTRGTKPTLQYLSEASPAKVSPDIVKRGFVPKSRYLCEGEKGGRVSPLNHH